MSIRLTSLPKNVQQSAMMMVEDISGELEPREVATAITDLEKKGEQNRNRNKTIATFVALTVFVIVAIFASVETTILLVLELYIVRLVFHHSGTPLPRDDYQPRKRISLHQQQQQQGTGRRRRRNEDGRSHRLFGRNRRRRDVERRTSQPQRTLSSGGRSPVRGVGLRTRLHRRHDRVAGGRRYDHLRQGSRVW